MKYLLQSAMYTTLQVSVILCAAFLALSDWTNTEDFQVEAVASTVESAHRNERSTPRSFVLPATPRIAFEEEEWLRVGSHQIKVTNCIKKLKNIGHDVGDGSPILNVHLVEAIYNFQTEHRLMANGQLDLATMEALNCS